MCIARSILVLGLLLLATAGCGGGGDGAAKSGDERNADRAEKSEETAVVEADLEVRLEHMGDKSSGAGIPIPTDISCTKSIPATCRAQFACPSEEPKGEPICVWLATDAGRDLLLADPPKNQMCTEQYGGPEVATVTGTLDGAQVNQTFSRTNGCEISRFDAAAPLWTREALTPANGAAEPPAVSAMCVAEDPDKPVSSDNPPTKCEDTVVEPEIITDPPEAFER